MVGNAAVGFELRTECRFPGAERVGHPQRFVNLANLFIVVESVILLCHFNFMLLQPVMQKHAETKSKAARASEITLTFFSFGEINLSNR